MELRHIRYFLAVAEEPRSVEADYEPGIAEADLGDQFLEAVALHTASARFAEILVNDLHALVGPPESYGAIDQPILQLRAAQRFGVATGHRNLRTLWADASQARDRIRVAARRNKKEKFTALLHHVTPEALRDAFYAIAKNAAAGIDGITWRDYEADLERKLADLHDRVQSGAYRATPSRRVYIPKPDGGQRPLAVAALEDKIVQRAVADVLNAIYEEDFLGFSYGFRPGRGAHDALDALSAAIYARKVNYIVDADIAKFFDSVSKEWLARSLEHRIGDKRVLRLIQKWLRAGVLEDGRIEVPERGPGQGAAISPLLANVYLHYVLDLWAERWRRREAKGDMVIVRYADDTIFGFEVGDRRPPLPGCDA